MRRMMWIMVVSVLISFQAVYCQKMTVKDNNLNVLMEVYDEGSVGSISLPQVSVPSETTNKLYNVG